MRALVPRHREVKQALHLECRLCVKVELVDIVVTQVPFHKGRGRAQLLGVSRNYDVFASVDYGQGVLNKYLRSLVEQHDVE